MNKRVLVNGALGRMGKEVVRKVVNDSNYLLVGACDLKNKGEDILKLLDLKGPEVIIQDDLLTGIRTTKPDVIIDFTTPGIVMDNIETGLSQGVDMIVGTTGITEVDLKEIDKLAADNKTNILIVPNFAIGAVLMMRFAVEAARYLSDVEIVELHHDQKIDAPSGTAMKTAELIASQRDEYREGNRIDEIEKLPGSRGGDKDGIRIHSLRLPGLVAHQEVIFGAEGQSLKIRHDSYNRSSFMPGVKVALEKIDKLNGLVYGLEKVL